MKNTIQLSLATVALLVTAGCGEQGVGGGAYQATSVVVLPPDLGGVAGDSEDTATTPDSAASESAGSGPGVFSGRVVLTGSAPGLAPLIAKGADVKDASVCAAEEVPDERLVLGADNGVANVFVSIVKAPKGSPKPTVSDQAVIFDQKNCQFLPHCMTVPVGQTVKVLSADDVAHNTHTNPSRNSSVSTLVAANDREGKLELVYKSSEREPFRVTCDFHGWMVAWHFPVDHPYVALTDADGNFEIPDLPSGDHVFMVWHEAAKGKYINRKLKVSIKPGETTTQEIEYAASQLDL